MYCVTKANFVLTGTFDAEESLLLSSSPFPPPLPFSFNISLIESSSGGGAGAERNNTSGRNSVELCSVFSACKMTRRNSLNDAFSPQMPLYNFPLCTFFLIFATVFTSGLQSTMQSLFSVMTFRTEEKGVPKR